jgi:hypothetical protein
MVLAVPAPKMIRPAVANSNVMCFFITLSHILKAIRLIRFHMNAYENDAHGALPVNRFAAQYWLRAPLSIAPRMR